MLSNSSKKKFIIVLQIILGLVFLISGFTKLIDLDRFSEALANFKLINNEILNIVKYLLPILEIALGIFIISNLNSSLPSFISALILSFFTALIVAKLFEGEEINCGCFGALSSEKLNLFSVFRNILLTLVAILISAFYENMNIKNPQGFEIKDIIPQKSFIKFIKTITLYNIIFFLAAQSLIFALQNNGLKSRLALLVDDHDILKKGEIVESFELNTLDGRKFKINYHNISQYSLLLLFKPTCSPCKLNLPNWNNLVNQIDTSRTRIFAISIDSLENTSSYCKNNLVNFQIFYTQADEFLLNYKAFLTPQTILISEKSTVINVWKGILDSDSINEILNSINKKEDII